MCVLKSMATTECLLSICRIQKAALKVILGKDYESYEKSLKILNMESLDQRRESMSLKFVKNGLKNLNFSKLFPLRRENHGMSIRQREKYHVTMSNTSRFKDSAVPFLQRLQNKDALEKKSLKKLLNHDRVVNDLKRSESNYNRVNYISNVDVIT